MSSIVPIGNPDSNSKRVFYYSDRKYKPKVLRVAPTGIPNKLQSERRWVVWPEVRA